MTPEELERRLAAAPPAPSGRALLRDEVHARLQHAIVTGVLPAGERLRDLDVAEALGVSRTPVREALRRLEDDGLVEAAASRWTRVTEVDIEEAGRIYPLVWALERVAIEIAPELPAAATLETANEQLTRALRDGDAIAASEADRAFHDAIVAAAGNPDLARILDELKLRLRRIEIAYFGGTTVAEPSIAEHARIIAAVATNDRTATAAAIEDNWRSPLTRLQRTKTPT